MLGGGSGILTEGLTPSFLERFEGGGLGFEIQALLAYETADYVQLAEEGMSRLKKLMRGEEVTDHRGHKWKLDS